VNFYNDDVDIIDSITRTALFGGTNMAMLGNEIITFQTITPVSGTVYKIEHVYRSRFDTDKQAHPIGTSFWFLGLSNYRIVQSPDLLKNTTRKFKMVPYNIVSLGDIADASVNSLYIEARAKKPYPPEDVKANGTTWHPTYALEIILGWNTRERALWAGIASADAQTDAESSWEGYYKIETSVSGIVVRTTTAIDDDEWTYSSAMNISDNGSLADEITFNVSNYISSGGIVYESVAREITVNKE
jgi:hypothetical protein